MPCVGSGAGSPSESLEPERLDPRGAGDVDRFNRVDSIRIGATGKLGIDVCNVRGVVALGTGKALGLAEGVGLGAGSRRMRAALRARVTSGAASPAGSKARARSKPAKHA